MTPQEESGFTTQPITNTVINSKFFEKHYVKITLSVIMGVIATVIWGTFMVTNLINNINVVQNTVAKQAELNDEQEKRLNSNDLIIVEIRTRLTNIDNSLLDIKQSLK